MIAFPSGSWSYAEVRSMQARDLLHLGDRVVVARALSRLVRPDQLLRICQGVYMRPIQTPFGHRAPNPEQAMTALANLWGERIASNGGDAANRLGLTTQNAVCTVYLTSGPDRLLCFGAHQVKLLPAEAVTLLAFALGIGQSDASADAKRSESLRWR